MLAKQDLAIELSNHAMDLLADLGYDPQFGARPMKRVLQKEIINQLSKELLSGKFKKGDTIFIDAVNGNLFFRNKADIKTPDLELPSEEDEKSEKEEKPKTETNSETESK